MKAWSHDAARAERIRFVFPDADPDELDTSEDAVLELVQARTPDAPIYEQVLDAIVAHRIITQRTPHTWELVERYLARGATRQQALTAAAAATETELWERYGPGDAA